MHPLGQTRTQVARNHAFIAPDSRLKAPLVGWTHTQAITLISPQMGANFHQYESLMESGAVSGRPLAGVTRFVYVLDGAVRLRVSDQTHALHAGHFALLPPDTEHEFSTESDSRLLVFEKRYVRLEGEPPPATVIGHESECASEANEGDPDAQLKRLLPQHDAFDFEMNVFTFTPGACLPQVEVHLPEHGLWMLHGQGVYRLENNWYPIQAEDVIWMGAFCPQWFCATGKTPASYLYYKDVRRDPLNETFSAPTA